MSDQNRDDTLRDSTSVSRRSLVGGTALAAGVASLSGGAAYLNFVAGAGAPGCRAQR